MGGVGEWLTGILGQNRGLAIIVLLVLAMTALSMVFAMSVMVIRVSHVRARKRTASMHERLQQPLLDILGGVAATDSIRNLAEPGEEAEILAFLLRYARRVRGSEAAVIAKVAEPFVPAAVRALKSRSVEQRALAVQALAAFGAAEHAPVVLAALDDASPYVAMTAAQALAKPEHARHAEKVMDRLWRFVDWSGDFLGAMLAKIGPAVVPSASRILESASAAPRARAVAAEVLRHLNDVPAASLAARVLDAERLRPKAAGREELRAAALRLVAQTGGDAQLKAVRPWAKSRVGVERVEALRALAAVGGAREVTTLVQAMRDSSSWVAYEAARGLLKLKRSDLVEEASQGESTLATIARQALAEAAHPDASAGPA